MTFFLFLLLFLVGFAVYIGKQYNEAQAKAQTIEEAQANIGVVIKKRFDLINKLVDLVGSYVNHEKLTHLAVVDGESVASLAQASLRADNTLTQLNSIARNYPDLKANASYNMLMETLAKVEAELQHRRETYNREVRQYNTFCNSIPFLFFAPTLGFRKALFFDLATADSDSTTGFSADDGTVLRQRFANAGTHMLEGTRTLGTALETHGRTLLERGQASLHKTKEPDTETSASHEHPDE